MPPGADVTVPVPVPSLTTVSSNSLTNVAVTVTSPSMSSVHCSVPLHPPPLQPANVDGASASAVRPIMEPIAKSYEQSLPQSMPNGTDCTLPSPSPSSSTVTRAVGVASIGVEVTSPHDD